MADPTAQLVVALDFQTGAEALDLARRLKGAAPWMKVGLELYVAEGPAIVRELKALGYKVFVDLKFLDIPNTVRGAVRFAFSDLALHRVEAACLPNNEPSRRLLERVGFRREGEARGYLRINGAWADHLLFGLLASDPPPERGRA